MGMSKKDIENLVKGSFERGDADRDWGTENDRRENIRQASNEPDPANDLPKP